MHFFYFLIFSLLLHVPTCSGFLGPLSNLNASFQNIHVACRPSPNENDKNINSSSCLHSDLSPDNQNETSEERAKRMEMVRQLQKSFYQNEEKILPPERGSTIIKDLPLWRVQWTELPGFQNVLNVHVAHYTNMFNKIIHSNTSTSNDTTPKYFGHLYLPGGSDNLDNPDYKMEEGSKSTMIGCLMQIADYKQMEDGRLMLIVQALEKFKVVDVQRHHSPYAVATVEIMPDDEVIEAFDQDDDDVDNVDGGDIDIDINIDQGLIDAVGEAFATHPYEVKSVTIAECMDDEGQGMGISPLANYDANFKIPHSKASISDLDRVFELEQLVWISLDEMLKLLQQLVDPKKERDLPIPTQILGLLPLEPIKPWPKGFALETYATMLEIDRLLVGTYSKSPFVRADNMMGYSPLRRAQRLSFVVWTLADTVMAISNEETLTRQDILEIESTEERLEIALSKFEQISAVIREIS